MSITLDGDRLRLQLLAKDLRSRLMSHHPAIVALKEDGDNLIVIWESTPPRYARIAAMNAWRVVAGCDGNRITHLVAKEIESVPIKPERGRKPCR